MKKKNHLIFLIILFFLIILSSCGRKSKSLAVEGNLENGENGTLPGGSLTIESLDEEAGIEFSSVNVGSTVDLVIDIIHSGYELSVISTDLEAPFEYKGGSFPGEGGTCSYLINDDCTVVLSFKPTAVGSYQKIFFIEFTDGTDITSTTVKLSAYGRNPISSGSNFACFVIDGTKAKCWGLNSFGQLGLGNTENMGDDAEEMGNNLAFLNFDFTDEIEIKQISSGSSHNCVLFSKGNVKCWGNGASGALGYGNTSSIGTTNINELYNLADVDLGTGLTVKKIASGTSFNCAILSDDSLKCWGLNSSGQLGLGNIENMGDGVDEMGDNLPVVDLGTGRYAVDIVARSNYACAILDNNDLKCWGNNGTGKLGRNDGNSLGSIGDEVDEMGDDLPAVNLGAERHAVKVALAADHACAILDNNDVKCWGANSHGQLGKSNTSPSNFIGDDADEMGDNLTPVALGTDLYAKYITLGDEQLSCVLLNDNKAKCWGCGYNGKGGHENEYLYGTDPDNNMGDNLPYTNVGTGRTVKILSSGKNSTCALLDNDELVCWGFNTNGELGKDTGNASGAIGRVENQMGDYLEAVLLESL